MKALFTPMFVSIYWTMFPPCPIACTGVGMFPDVFAVMVIVLFAFGAKA